MGLQRVGHDWATDLIWSDLIITINTIITLLLLLLYGGTMETVSDFIFLGSQITADGDCSHETKRHLLPGRKAMTNLDSMLKSRVITLPTKICLV